MSFSASISSPRQSSIGGKWRRLSAQALLFSATLVLAGCANLETTAPPVTPLLVSRGHADASTLASGRNIYLTKCVSCHAPASVAGHAGKWPRIIADMALRAKLAPDQERAVLAYVLAAERAQ